MLPRPSIFWSRLVLAAALLVPMAANPAHAQDPRPEGDALRMEVPLHQSEAHFGSSPFDPREVTDQIYVVDQGSGLDTSCTFRSGGPLVIQLEIERVAGDVEKLLEHDLISPTAKLRMPGFDVDSAGGGGGFAPERDRVSFNGQEVGFLSGVNNDWRLSSFDVDIRDVNFATEGGGPGINTIRIDIDVANSQEVWCTAVDWAELSVDRIVRPVIMAHGILSEGSVWGSEWVPGLDERGVPNSNDLDMGNLDGIGANAGKIAAEVAAKRELWGVDKVVLVGHSKGGLDSRHYAEDADDVEQVIQIGTPNGGSPLADYIQGGIIYGLGPLGAVGANALVSYFQGPAGIQLTRPYMTVYNLRHGSNGDVGYHALAGAYDADCPFYNPFCRPVPRFLNSLVGRGDTIVPVPSVHTLGYTTNYILSTSGEVMDTIHACFPFLGISGCQMQSSNIFEQMFARTIRFTGQQFRLDLAAAPPAWGASAAEGGVLENGGSASFEIAVDREGETFFHLFYPAGDFELTLVSPSGRRIDAAVSDPQISFTDVAYLDGRLALYDLAPAEAGIWTVEVSASGLGPNDSAAYTVGAVVEGSTVHLDSRLVDDAVPAGEPLVIEARLLDAGTPLFGATADAWVARPDGSYGSVVLTDDGTGGDAVAGDGLLTGTFADTAEAGLYRIAVTARGPSASRQALLLGQVSRSRTALSGVYTDYGVDTDGDGLFNELAVEVGLDVTDARDYRVYGVLTDSAGNEHRSNGVYPLAAGTATVTLTFDGEDLYANGVDGPYTLAVVRVAEEDGLALLPVAEASDAHLTAAYGFVEFEHSAISLTGTGTATGRDTNGNGLYDFLDVTFGVRLEQSGFYRWTAALFDGAGREIGFATGAGSFGAGFRTLGLTFNGRTIGESGSDGPYRVGDLLLYGGGQSLVAPTVFETQAFRADQFEGYTDDNRAPELTVVLTPDLLWPPNHRMVDVAADITVTDDKDPSPTVELVSVVSDEAEDGLGDGDTEVDIQGVDAGTDDRAFSLRAERSGRAEGRTYTVTYRATDQAGNVTEVEVTVRVPHQQLR